MLAHLLAGHQVDRTGAYVPMTSLGLQQAWHTLRAKYAEAFAVAPEQSLARQRRQAEESARAQAVPRAVEEWNQGYGYLQSNQWSKAITAFSRAIILDPLSSGPYHDRREAYAEALRFRDAIRDCNEVLWRWAGDSWPQGFIQVYSSRAWYHLELREYKEALTDFQKAIELAPEGINNYHSLARAYATGPPGFRSPEKALPLAQKVIQMGDHQNFINTLGIVYYRLGQFQKSIELLEKNVKTESGLVTALDWLCLAMCYQRVGETVKAKTYFGWATKWQDLNGASLKPLDRQELESFRAEADEVLGQQKADSKAEP